MRTLVVESDGFGGILERFDLIKQLDRAMEEGWFFELVPWEIVDLEKELARIRNLHPKMRVE